MKKIASLIMTLSLLIILVACGTTKVSNNDHKSSNNSESSEPKTEKVKNSKQITNHDYNLIQIGSVRDGKGGTSKSEVIKQFGNPQTENKTNLPGTSAKAPQYSWKNISKSFKVRAVAVTFINNKAVGKAYLSDFGKDNKVTPIKKINKYKKGASYYTILKDLGKPNAESISGVGKESGKNLTYVVNKKNDSVSLVFINDKLISKSEATLW